MKIATTIMVVLSTSILAFAAEPTTTQPTTKEVKAQVKEQVQEAKTKVTNACADDAAKAGCTGQSAEIGKGLMKCLHAYKKEHKDFKVSDSCKMASKDMKEKRAEMKEMRKHAQEQKSTEVKK